MVFACGRDEVCLHVFLPVVKELYPDCTFIISSDTNDPIQSDYGLSVVTHTWNPPSERNITVLNALLEAQVLTNADYVGKLDCDALHFSREWFDIALKDSPGAVGFAAPPRNNRRYLYGMCYLIHRDTLVKIGNKGGCITNNFTSYEDLHMSERLNNVSPELPVLIHNHVGKPLVYGGIATASVEEHSEIRDKYQVMHCGEVSNRNSSKDVALLMKKILHTPHGPN